MGAPKAQSIRWDTISVNTADTSSSSARSSRSERFTIVTDTPMASKTWPSSAAM